MLIFYIPSIFINRIILIYQNKIYKYYYYVCHYNIIHYWLFLKIVYKKFYFNIPLLPLLPLPFPNIKIIIDLIDITIYKLLKYYIQNKTFIIVLFLLVLFGLNCYCSTSTYNVLADMPVTQFDELYILHDLCPEDCLYIINSERYDNYLTHVLLYAAFYDIHELDLVINYNYLFDLYNFGVDINSAEKFIHGHFNLEVDYALWNENLYEINRYKTLPTIQENRILYWNPNNNIGRGITADRLSKLEQYEPVEIYFNDENYYDENDYI